MSRAPDVSFRAAARSPACAVVLAVVLSACAGTPAAVAPEPPRAPLDSAAAARVLALDCAHLSDADVRGALAPAPAPRVVLLQGSLAFVTMEPFGEFLAAMGYPAERIRNPRDGSMSYSSFTHSEALAGMLAWHYERDGMMPVLIGHSQGGMLVVRTLYELAGEFADAIPVRDPASGDALARTTIVDPATGRERPVVGLQVPYAAAIATGKLPRLLLGQWSMLPRLRRIPDTAIEFTGFSIAFDPIAGDFGGADPYVATGTARVRNVLLPAGTSHILIPKTAHLAANPLTRAWIDAYSPGAPASPLPEGDVDATNILHAADIWWSVRRNWCVEAQRRLRAPRVATAP